MNEGIDLRDLLDSIFAFVAILSPDGVLLEVNRTPLEPAGLRREDVIGKPFVETYWWSSMPESQAQMRRALESAARGEIVREDFEVRITDDRLVTVEGVITPLKNEAGEIHRLVASGIDITERKRAEKALRQSHKMEGIGQLAAGVAHDFNNLLTVITGYSDLVIASLAPGDPNREPLEEIRKAGTRSAALTRQLLAFSRKQVLAPKVLALNDVVRDTAAMLRRVIGDDVQLVAVLHSGAGTVRVDPGQMEQVLLNVGVNAREAMPRGGTLTIETKDVELDKGYANANAGVSPGPYVMLAMTDSGTGMSEEIQRHLFEPFFTTKGPGQGSGLGLAMVHGFIKQSAGHVEVQSAEGVGTTFRIFLPRLKPVVAPAGSAAPAGPRGTETILLVEDDPAVRALTRRVLERYGYTVLDTGDGHEALRIASTRDGPIHLLVTDVEMPRMAGRVVAERLLAVRPATKVLYFSGYTDDSMVRHSISHDTIHFLQKPFSMEALALKVREALAR